MLLKMLSTLISFETIIDYSQWNEKEEMGMGKESSRWEGTRKVTGQRKTKEGLREWRRVSFKYYSKRREPEVVYICYRFLQCFTWWVENIHMYLVPSVVDGTLNGYVIFLTTQSERTFHVVSTEWLKLREHVRLLEWNKRCCEVFKRVIVAPLEENNVFVSMCYCTRRLS